MWETTCTTISPLSLSDNGIISFFFLFPILSLSSLSLSLSLQSGLDLRPLLVDLGLVEALDDVGAVKEATPGGVGAAQRLAALDDVVVAGDAALGDTAEGSAA